MMKRTQETVGKIAECQKLQRLSHAKKDGGLYADKST